MAEQFLNLGIVVSLFGSPFLVNFAGKRFGWRK